MRKDRTSHVVTGPSSIDWAALLDRTDDAQRRTRVRQFRTLLEVFRCDRASREAPPRQLARQIQAAAAQWRGATG